jgi:hypothetical protein
VSEPLAPTPLSVRDALEALPRRRLERAAIASAYGIAELGPREGERLDVAPVALPSGRGGAAQARRGERLSELLYGALCSLARAEDADRELLQAGPRAGLFEVRLAIRDGSFVHVLGDASHAALVRAVVSAPELCRFLAEEARQTFGRQGVPQVASEIGPLPDFRRLLRHSDVAARAAVQATLRLESRADELLRREVATRLARAEWDSVLEHVVRHLGAEWTSHRAGDSLESAGERVLGHGLCLLRSVLYGIAGRDARVNACYTTVSQAAERWLAAWQQEGSMATLRGNVALRQMLDDALADPAPHMRPVEIRLLPTDARGPLRVG